MNTGITAIEYTLGEEHLSLLSLEEQRLLDSPAEQLQEFGFAFCHVSRRSAASLAKECAQRLASGS